VESCSGKVAFVTGASRGIGKAIALRLAGEGAAVVACATRLGRHDDRQGTLEGTVEEIERSGGRACALVADLSDPAVREGLIAQAQAPFGELDILVNNAAGAIMTLPSRATRDERNFMYEMNLNAPVDLAQQVIPGMQARGGGWILNITSASAKQPPLPYRDTKLAAHMIGPYGATKAALDRYTEALAHEVAEHGIFVNALAPVSIVLTSSAQFVKPIAEKNPDMAEPVEMMAEAALELCTGRHVGRVVLSRDFVHAVGRSVHSLDGKQVLGDAFMAADLDATA
jgi:citronellol/citronellal dehydrogenase